jgi:uncharacterized protein YacL (UPF0231 family)
MTEFPRIREEIEDLKNILKRNNLTGKGKELLKEYEFVLNKVENLSLCAVSHRRELLEAYQHFIDWNEEHDRKKIH